jgi:hypothetical protein
VNLKHFEQTGTVEQSHHPPIRWYPYLSHRPLPDTSALCQHDSTRTECPLGSAFSVFKTRCTLHRWAYRSLKNKGRLVSLRLAVALDGERDRPWRMRSLLVQRHWSLSLVSWYNSQRCFLFRKGYNRDDSVNINTLSASGTWKLWSYYIMVRIDRSRMPRRSP